MSGVVQIPLTEAQHKQLIVAAAMDLLEQRWALENIAVLFKLTPAELQRRIDETIAATDQRSPQQRTH